MEDVIFRIIEKELRLIIIVGDKSSSKDFKDTFQYLKLMGDNEPHWYRRDLLMVPMDYLVYKNLDEEDKKEAKIAIAALFEEGIQGSK